MSLHSSTLTSNEVVSSGLRNTKQFPFSNPFGFAVIRPPNRGNVVLCPSELCFQRGHHVALKDRVLLLKPDSAIQIIIRAEFRVQPEADWVCRSPLQPSCWQEVVGEAGTCTHNCRGNRVLFTFDASERGQSFNGCYF